MSEWVKRWGYWMSKSPARGRSGIYRLKDGGFYVYTRLTNPRTGKLVSFTKALPTSTIEEAQKVFDELRENGRNELLGRLPPKMRFDEFAASHFEGKVLRKELRSAASVELWQDTLEHHLLPAFGHFECAQIEFRDIQAWQDRMAVRVNEPKYIVVDGREIRNKNHYSPRTINGWFRILENITQAMVVKFDLPRDPCTGIKPLDESTYATYTEEEPNSLPTEKVRAFLAAMKEMYPQHYAMTLLGFITGLRPSSMRPLRLGVDALLDQGKILIRRSSTRGEVMERTKTAYNQSLFLPDFVIQVLKDHVERFSGIQKASGLLFPGEEGKMRSAGVLDKPFDNVCKAVGITMNFTPRGLRRTFKDLSRDAQVSELVRKKVSGHITDQMDEHYSTVRGDEMRSELNKVVSLLEYKKAVSG